MNILYIHIVVPIFTALETQKKTPSFHCAKKTPQNLGVIQLN